MLDGADGGPVVGGAVVGGAVGAVVGGAVGAGVGLLDVGVVASCLDVVAVVLLFVDRGCVR